MDIKILDSHLREYLDTEASPEEIAKYMSLCGPTFDRVHKVGKDYLYEIEVTTNRVDAASVTGIAREAAAILPQFGLKTKLKLPIFNYQFSKRDSLPLKLVSDPKLERRLTGVVIEDIKNWQSPKWMIERLEAAGIRPLNSVVDITNYVMITAGHPCHAFDYDAIEDAIIKVRESKKGESITTFDGKVYKLPGGDILFEDAGGKVIDLPGIMGLKNSVVSTDTKRVLFFFDNNNSVRIRRTSMSTGIRTMAATLNEKQVDPELVPIALNLGIHLYQEICKAKVASAVHDNYENPFKGKTVETTLPFIQKILGTGIDKNKIDKLLCSLEFSPKWKGDKLTVSIPSFRAHDINIAEDIVEEVARIYGYHNLPSQIMEGALPEPVFDTPFKFEDKLRQTLKSFGGAEVLTYSLAAKDMAGERALKLKNPLGRDTEYLRTTLKPSVLKAAAENKRETDPLHLFEIANVYNPRKNDLPEERMTLAGILTNYDYRKAKGVLEALFETLNIKAKATLQIIGDIYYYEFEVPELEESVKPRTFVQIPKYPPQIEDITVQIAEDKSVGDVVQSIKQADKLVQSVELVDIYERNFTFRIEYLHPDKTLSDKEVEKIRGKIASQIN